jgi:uncharacterized membrane protein
MYCAQLALRMRLRPGKVIAAATVIALVVIVLTAALSMAAGRVYIPGAADTGTMPATKVVSGRRTGIATRERDPCQTCQT